MKYYPLYFLSSNEVRNGAIFIAYSKNIWWWFLPVVLNKNNVGNTSSHWIVAVEVQVHKSLSETFILTSTNPQYDNRLFIDLPVQYMKTTSPEHGENMLYTQIVFCFCFDIQNNFCTHHVLSPVNTYTVRAPL